MANRTTRTLSPLLGVLASGCCGGVLLFVAPTVTSNEPALRGSPGTRGELHDDYVSGKSQGASGFWCFAAVGAACAAVAHASRARSSLIMRRAEPVSAAAAAAAAAKGAAAAKAASAAGAKAASGAVGIGAGTGKSVKGGDAPQDYTFDPSVQVGAMAPLGFFDPAGFCKKGDEPGFRNLRAAEIKHGRVAMMAALGAVVQHYVQFPGFTEVPKGLGAVVAAPGSYGFAALFATSGLLELALWTENPSKEPGNFGDPAGFDAYTTDNRNREINNGRFAMFAALGIISAELLTGKDAVQQFGL